MRALSTIGLLLTAAAGVCSAAGPVQAVTAAQLDAAVPKARDAARCQAGPGECATNAQAAAAISRAIQKYGVTARGEVVALVALMAYESDSWTYNINHFPGRAGQGTRAMLMYPYVLPYARALHSAQVSDAAAATADDATMNSVRGLVLNDDDSFGSAFWFLVTTAPQYHASASRLRDGNLDDFKSYVVDAVGGTWDDGRESTWHAVNNAL
ncbi:hypothetical protein H4R18_003377 [Coemansia javaensis]|uniref:Uncharacterized protein n=1 Tax=Coemansia javaensis TaxID=2761396 RepID=A0A9W8HFL3_9FUNG|nr:hypothetical protein H4R18_003377 [Coemansia javaensis]